MKYLSLIVSFLFLNVFLFAQVSQANDDPRTDTIDKSFDYDIGIEAERVNFWSTGEIFGESGFYGQIPYNQINGTNNITSFSAIIKNYGTVTTIPQLNISVRNEDDDEIYSQTVTLGNELEPGESDTITTHTPYFDLDDFPHFGFIKFDFSCSIVGNIDENLENNFKSDSTKITLLTFARDNNSLTGSINPCDLVGGCNDSDRIGVVYEFNQSTEIESIDFWVAEGTPIGSVIVPKLLEFDEGLNDWVEFGWGPLYEISNEDIGTLLSLNLEDDSFVVINENEPKEIIVALEFYYGFETSGLVLGVDHTVPTNGFENLKNLSSENEWTPLDISFSPIIRLTLDYYDKVNNSYYQYLHLFPNPTSGIIQFENFQTQHVEVINIDGQIVKTCEFNANASEIDISELENGTYFLKLLVKDEFIVKKVILIK